MYPGREGSSINHRHGFCADGVKQTSKIEELPPWPQPQLEGLFLDGRTFHPVVFLDTLKHIVERAVMDLPNALTAMEDEAFTNLIKSRTFRTDSGRVLFRLFKEFSEDPSMHDSYYHTQDGVKYLQLAYLEETD